MRTTEHVFTSAEFGRAVVNASAAPEGSGAGAGRYPAAAQVQPRSGSSGRGFLWSHGHGWRGMALGGHNDQCQDVRTGRGTCTELCSSGKQSRLQFASQIQLMQLEKKYQEDACLPLSI